MKKKLLNLLIPLLAIPSTMRADGQHSLIIDFHDGSSVAVVLAHKPHATFIGDSLQVETNDFSGTYPRNAIAGFHFDWYDPATSSLGTSFEKRVQIVYTDNNRVQVRGITDTSTIDMYSLDGRKLNTSFIPEDDGITIDLTEHPAEIYLIHINNKQIFKITKQ